MKDLKNKWLILAGAVAAFATYTATANTITPHSLVMPTPGVWVYSADHSSAELHAGDAFTIFDFGGYVAGSIYAPALWTKSATLLGSDPAGASLGPDDPTLYNLRFVYTGPSIQTLGVVGLGLFGATTTDTAMTVDDWISRDHLIGKPNVIGDGGLGTIHRDQILVPVGVPDGGTTVLLLGVGLSGLAFAKRKLMA